MNKLGIWGIVIAVAFVVGVLSANPVVDAVGGWQAAVAGLQEQIDNTSGQVYEVSGVSVIPAGEVFGNEVQLRCLEGDRYEGFVILRPQPPPSNVILSTINAQTTTIHESDVSKIFFSRAIGLDVTPQNQGIVQPFDITVTVVGICLSPSS